jgi:putative endopeptidase
MRIRRRVLAVQLLFLAVVASAAIGFGAPPAQEQAQRGFDLANLDKSCKPCEDFNRFASGGWVKTHPIPPEYPYWGSFATLTDENQKKMKAVLESAADSKSTPAGSNQQKIGDFFASCMDTTAIDGQGLKPLQSALDEIAAITRQEDLPKTVAHLHALRSWPMFRFDSTLSLKDSSTQIGEADQSGLGLPDRDYYLKDDADSRALRDKYVAHVVKIFELMGDSAEQASRAAKVVMDTETALARVSWSNVQLRNPETQYHMMNRAALKELTPHFSWDAYFAGVHHPELGEVNIAQPDYFKGLDAELAARSLADWKTYLRWQVVNRMAQFLSNPFEQEDFAFNDKTLTGTPEISPRWKRCERVTERNLGDAVGHLYVQKFFPPSAKGQMQELVKDLIAALRADIPTLEWMGAETKKAALAKLDAFDVQVGYPSKWIDYSGLTIDRGPYALNVMRAMEFASRRSLNKIGRPVDRAEWPFPATTVDAFNRGQFNQIVFPAGILQPPFFDPQRDDAYNYGGIGAVIGHEITHGFDDEGAKLDSQGNLRNWWTPADLKNFQDRGECVASQFNGYVVMEDVHENGKLVEGESIADLGGLAIAYSAYQRLLERKPAKDDGSGFTPEQRFFMGYSQVWAINERPELERLFANTNPHALPRFRVNGPLSNMAEFAKAFGCKKGDPMVRENVCKIW